MRNININLKRRMFRKLNVIDLKIPFAISRIFLSY